ncbi:MAG: DUF357 domain-containing protein [Methanomicrobiaceae archaeon]|nr:DUF357 domain-containing protein [Methanomicrobiaceae archaeon]
MKIKSTGELLGKTISSSAICPPEGTPMHRAAEDIMEMAYAYLYDGGQFLESGDQVNALASYAYGQGWLDAGIYTGLISGSGNPEFISIQCDKEIPESLREHLVEKTGRYHRMLDSAIKSVVAAPDTECPLFEAAIRIIEEAVEHLETGIKYKDGNENTSLSSALRHFSYGYGWLDAGVRTGILSITGDRTLFTI